jgi:hypothetical protein
LREGGKMDFTFFWGIGPKNYIKYADYSMCNHDKNNKARVIMRIATIFFEEFIDILNNPPSMPCK